MDGKGGGLVLGEPCAALPGYAGVGGGRQGRGAPASWPLRAPRAGRWERIQTLAPFLQLLLRHLQVLKPLPVTGGNFP